MRALFLFALFAVLSAAIAAPAPQRSALQTGPSDFEKPFIEEVVVESVLQVRNPSGRSSRTNTHVSLKDGARVSEMKTTQ